MEFYVNQKQYNSRKSLKYDLQNTQNKMKEKPFRKLYERIKRGLTKRFGGSVTSSDRNVEYNQVNRLNRELQLEHEIDTASEISNSSEVSKVALQQIREQMAVSLARMKDLEEQVKLIPNLKSQLVNLEDEKCRLNLELKRSEESIKHQRLLQQQQQQQLQHQQQLHKEQMEQQQRSSSKSSSPPTTTTTSGIFTPQRISPISLSSLNDAISHIKSAKQLRTTGTSCTPITRDVGCSPPPVKSQSTGVHTDISIGPNEKIYTKRDLENSLKEMERKQDIVKMQNSVSVGIQISDTFKPYTRHTGIQTVPLIDAIQKTTIGLMCRPDQREKGVMYAPQLISVGVSDDTISEPPCAKCNIKRYSVAVGPDIVSTSPSLSLRALEQRSSTFSLGEHEKLKLRRKHASTQAGALMSHASTQHSPLCATKMVHVSPETYTQYTDTKHLIDMRNAYTSTDHKPIKSKDAFVNTETVRTREYGVNANVQEKRSDRTTNTDIIHKRDFGCGDIISKGHIQILCADNYCDSCKDSIRGLARDFAKTEFKEQPLRLSRTPVEILSTPPPQNETDKGSSRIPKLTGTTPSPTMPKKFMRQNTYTVDSPSVEKSFIPNERKSPAPKTPEFLRKAAGLSLSSLKSPTGCPLHEPKHVQFQSSPPITSPTIPSPLEIAATESEIELLKKQTKDLFSAIGTGSIDEMRTTTVVTEQTLSPIQVSGESTKDIDLVGGLTPNKGQTPEKGEVSPLYEQSEEDEQPQGNSGEENQQQQKEEPAREAPRYLGELQIPRSAEALYNQLLQQSSNTERTKTSPTKEMSAALKVINDSLQKSSAATSNLKNANKIVQKEWFQISSTDSANPLDVEDYLDCFDEYSSDLLRYMVNLIDANGNTAMHYAVSHGNFDVVSILLDSKVCHVNQTNNAGYTCVMLVSLAKLRTPEHRTVVQRLFQMSDVNIRAKKHNQTALMLAVSHGNLEMVKMLLEAGADINIQDDDGSSSLMCAAEHGRIDIVKLLLAQPDCDSTIQDIDGSTALKISLEAGYRDIGVLLYAHEHMSRNKSPYASLRRKKERTISGGSNGGGSSGHKSSSTRTSPLPSPKMPSKREPFRP